MFLSDISINPFEKKHNADLETAISAQIVSVMRILDS